MPVLIVVFIVFLKFLKKHNQKTILWCIFAIVDYKLAILIFLLFFLDEKYSIKKAESTSSLKPESERLKDEE